MSISKLRPEKEEPANLFAKGGKTHCKKPCFATRKTSFHDAKGHLLESSAQHAENQPYNNLKAGHAPSPGKRRRAKRPRTRGRHGKTRMPAMRAYSRGTCPTQHKRTKISNTAPSH